MMMQYLITAAIFTICYYFYYCSQRKQKFNLNGKTVLITGAGSGIGRDMALYLSTKGVRRIVLWDRNLDGSNETKRKIGSAVEVLVDRVDVSSPRDVIKASKNLKEVDVLINNAGVVTGKYLLDMTDDEIQRTMSTNSLAHFWTTRAFLPYMLRRGDECAVVTVSSLMGQMSGCKLTDYCASKHAANGFHKALRLELRALCKSSVVHTMLVCPYVIDTGMFSGAFEGSGKPWFMRIGLFPKLKSQFVAKTIIQNLESRSHLVVLPWYFRYVPPVLHLFPASLMDWIEEFAGGRIGMNEFRGRQRNVSSS